MLNKKYGCLLIHGFTSFRASLEILIPELEKRDIAWHYPILAGHNTKPEDLEGKTWKHWQEDVEEGLKYLLHEVESIKIIALSMGSLLALELAKKYPSKVESLVLLSPALHFKNPLTKYTPQIKTIVNKVPGIGILRFSSLGVSRKNKTYSWFPAKTFHHYWLRTQHFDSVLEKIFQPTLIIHSKKDRLANPSGAEHIFNTIKSEIKEIKWLNKSGHEMLIDIEAEKVVKLIFSSKILRNLELQK